jgi:chromosome segregation protein
MQLTKLRLLGFKSFVEATDVLIQPGLTGIVGPNGCGKSNLVEALRWAMGESSHKNLRAAEMDDVIFAGSGTRPARNSAEVVLTVENRERTAPAAFNDTDLLEISRRIERDHGSTYRINGREVRARDVQLIFADASTGARSPALVRQGQIAELIAAKPQARRRILEEAAGISGLHSRRHEAELRLKAAEHNLERLEDVLAQIEAQLDGLKRQSRQAARYRSLSGQIRRAEALLLHIGFEEAGRNVIEAETRLDKDLREVAERTRAQAEAARRAAVATHEMRPLREAEAAAAAGLHRLNLAREALDAEERRAAARSAELDRRIAQARDDLARESALLADAEGALQRLASEREALGAEDAASVALAASARERLGAAETTLSQKEEAMARAQADLATQQANRTQAERTARDSLERRRRLEAQLSDNERARAALAREASSMGDLVALGAALDQAKAAAEEAEARMVAAEAETIRSREAEAASRGPLEEAERRAQRLETEARTLSKLVLAPSGGRFPPVVDAITVAKGMEVALGAALGDDLDASSDTAAPAYWGGTETGSADPALPEGAQPLLNFVRAPAALSRRLAQVGLVDRAEGKRLLGRLLPGQRLVSREGDLWRWDGYVAAAEAPTAAARRLSERNRLAELEATAGAAREAVGPAKAEAEAAQAALRKASDEERRCREDARSAARAADEARDRLAAAERRGAEVASRLSALEEARQRLGAGIDEADMAHRTAQAALAVMADLAMAAAGVEGIRAEVARERAALADAKAAVQTFSREADARGRRIEAIAADAETWTKRLGGGTAQMATLSERLAELTRERETLDAAPAAFAAQRRDLLSLSTEAESGRKDAADRLAEAESRLAAADRDSRETLAALASAREQHVRTEERLDALRARRAEIAREVQEALGVPPSAILRVAGIAPGDPLPDRRKIEHDLEAGRREREKLGPVNLRAEEEQREVQAQLDGLVGEREDLVEAIKRLRQAIASLNREGRERLLAAFETVNGHFHRLFVTLFGGGAAELQLTESDDPLEAGLDMLARPPGKKPQTLSLLSGGEQALTAMALIFAVFLTNPAPICVLDEVDAPLDDANVERFCNLLDEMTKLTRTRFVTITHNPITMARMDRLYGVTMAERGVSQLVSVNLVEAERYREAV